MQRGFKTHAKRLALEIRAEVEAERSDPFDPWELAQLYGVPVYDLDNLADFDCPTAALRYFGGRGAERFSAALVPVGTGRLVIENSHHAPTRRRVNVSHEMSHIVLEHNFGLALLMPDGCRAVAPDVEEEAAWLAGELLIPYVVALKAARAGWTDEQVAEHFQVSPRLAAWRMNHSGARKVAERQLAFRSSRRS